MADQTVQAPPATTADGAGPDDRELVEKAQHGDGAAFAELVARHQR